jgi:hypothetical protein
MPDLLWWVQHAESISDISQRLLFTQTPSTTVGGDFPTDTGEESFSCEQLGGEKCVHHT